MKRKGIACSTFVYLFILGMGAIWLVVTVQGMNLAKESASWLSTTGTIADTWIDRYETTDADGDAEVRYKPNIKYTYVVNGGNFHSRRVDFGPQPSYSRSAKAEEYLAEYPVGREVEVFYDPNNYGEAVLIREASGSTFGLIGGAVMIVGSVVAWIGGKFKAKRSPELELIEEIKKHT
jgi:hypothetical protein